MNFPNKDDKFYMLCYFEHLINFLNKLIIGMIAYYFWFTNLDQIPFIPRNFKYIPFGS